MSGQKKFCVVVFPNDNKVEVIPTAWLKGEENLPQQLGKCQAMWPKTNSTHMVTRYISHCKPPEDNWEVCDVIVKCYSRSLNRANIRANALMESSSPGSVSSESDEGVRKRKIPKRFLTSSSDEDISFRKINKYLEKNSNKILRSKKKHAIVSSSFLQSRSLNRANASMESSSLESVTSEFGKSVRERKVPKRFITLSDEDVPSSKISRYLEKNSNKIHRLKKKHTMVSSLLQSRNFNRASALMESSSPESVSSGSDEEVRKEKAPKRFITLSDEDISSSKIPQPKKKHTIVSSFLPSNLDDSLVSSVSIKEEPSEAHSQSLLTLVKPTHFNLTNEPDTAESLLTLVRPTDFDPRSEPDTSNNNHESFRNNSEMESFCSRIITSMERMEQSIKVLQRQQENLYSLVSDKFNLLEDKSSGSANCFYILPDGLELPVTSNAALETLNNKLQEDASLSLTLARYLQVCEIGKTDTSFLLNVTKRILTRDVAILYSRLGRKGKKCFADLNAIYNVILAAASEKFPHSTKEDLAEKFGKILSTAIDWDGKGVERRKSASIKNS